VAAGGEKLNQGAGLVGFSLGNRGCGPACLRGTGRRSGSGRSGWTTSVVK
jgi:hypothetical protein